MPASESHISQTIEHLEGEVRSLQGRVASQQARQRALQQERDVLWDSYSTVFKKAEEGRIAGLVGSGKEVSIAGQSLAEPRSRRLSTLLPLAAVAGATVAAALALFVGYVAPTYGDLVRQSRGRPLNGSQSSGPTRRPEEAGALSP